MKKTHESTVISYSDKNSLRARSEIFGLLRSYKATDDETERSLGLFLRSSLLARIFAIRELYEKIVSLPGAILDIGTWRGQTAVVCENLRAIFEPLHFNRRIVCFDTFDGYEGFSDRDKTSALHKDGTYSVGGEEYAQFLSQLLVLHEQSNAMGHNSGKHRVIRGDVRKTLPSYFEETANEAVSLAFFDINSFNPTLEAFRLIYRKVVPGGLIAFWQLTRDATPAEGMVYVSEILDKYPHKIERSQFYPGLCFLTKT